jgi:hypothetical protein
MAPAEARSGEIATPPTPQLSRLAIALAVAALAFLAFYVIQFRGYTMDDAYMSYRYAEHLATGQGLVFNPGENPRSEGVTSPLWAGLLSLCYLLGSDPRVASKVLGLLSVLLTIGLLYGLIYALCRRQLGRSVAVASVFGALGALTYVSDPYVAGNGVSGMETALGTLVYCAFVFGLVERLDALRPRDVGLLGLAAVAMCGLRPELGLSVVAALALAAVLCRGSRLPLLAIGGSSSLWEPATSPGGILTTVCPSPCPSTSSNSARGSRRACRP